MHEAEVTCHTGNGTTARDSRVGKEYWLVILEEDELVIQHSPHQDKQRRIYVCMGNRIE